jgi:ligand-binding sensor domain-containing protein/signal transduction histidine kinase
MLRHFILSAILLIIGICFHLQAQIITPKFERISIGIAFCFLQDSNGFLWIGSQEGLVRYDGYNLKFYSHIPFDSTSLSNNWITEIKEDKKGNLWVCTYGGGLNYFDQKTEKFSHFLNESVKENVTNSKTISSMILNDDGTLWLGTKENGLIYMSFDIWGKALYKSYNFSYSKDVNIKKKENFVWCLLKDRKEKLWIGTIENGLIYFDPETENFKHYKYNSNNPEGIKSNLITSICEDDSGTIWFATGHLISNIPGTGLGRFNPSTQTFSYFNHNPNDQTSICSNSPFYLFIDRSQTLWIGTTDNGICSVPLRQLYSGAKPKFNQYEGLGSNIINRIFEDKDENLWIAPWAVFMSKYDRKEMPFIWYHKEYGNSNSLSSSGIECLFVDHCCNIWFGHHFTGLTKYDQSTEAYKHYRFDTNNLNRTSPDWINAICEDDEGKLWLGTAGNGIDIFNPADESVTRIKADPESNIGLRSNRIRFLCKSLTGNIWISNWQDGLQLYDMDSKKFINYDIDSTSKEDENTSCLYEDSQGFLWIGTFNDGFYRLKIENKKIKQVKHYTHNPQNRNSLSSNFILDIIQTKSIDSNYLWIATNIGLNKFDINKEIFTHYFKKDGLPHDFILKVLEDKFGNIWAATAYKLCVYNISTNKFNIYSEKDGLPFTGFGGARQNSTTTCDGQLLFGSSNGALGFIPEKVLTNSKSSKIYFTDFRIFHESVHLDTSISFKNKIELEYYQNVISFEFTDLNFSSSNKNQFAYKLEGLYDEWINIGDERKINFTNLEPGKYIFRVNRAEYKNISDETEASIYLIIYPPWWATWWFRTLMIITLMGIGYSIYHYRINKVLEMERLRIQIASDLHDDIGSALTKIAVHSEIIQTTKEKEKVSRSSKKIGTMSREIITTLSDVVWSIDSRNDTVGYLIDRMRDFLETVFPAGSIHIDFQTKGLHFDQKVNQTLRQNIYLIFKEAVNNAAKHSGADKINISLINGDGKFKMEIADNGMGINKEEKQKGHHGIENMKLRAKRINGELTIQNLAKGTRVILIAKNI